MSLGDELIAVIAIFFAIITIFMLEQIVNDYDFFSFD